MKVLKWNTVRLMLSGSWSIHFSWCISNSCEVPNRECTLYSQFVLYLTCGAMRLIVYPFQCHLRLLSWVATLLYLSFSKTFSIELINNSLKIFSYACLSGEFLKSFFSDWKCLYQILPVYLNYSRRVKMLRVLETGEVGYSWWEEDTVIHLKVNQMKNANDQIKKKPS